MKQEHGVGAGGGGGVGNTAFVVAHVAFTVLRLGWLSASTASASGGSFSLQFRLHPSGGFLQKGNGWVAVSPPVLPD